jgi:AcrR family transcriptional regulator
MPSVRTSSPAGASPGRPRKQDHRARVGAERREKTRLLLLESAMLVFARRGVEASVIDEVIGTAGMSRGTFYNYFRSNEELLAAVARAVSDEMLRIVDPVALVHADPAARVATGVRSMLAVARTHPHLAAFMVRGGIAALSTQGLAVEALARDVAAGMDAGRFSRMHPRLAFDVVAGSVLAGMHTLLTAKAPRSYPEKLAGAILRALGVPKATAERLANLPLAGAIVPPESLLARAEARAARPRAP